MRFLLSSIEQVQKTEQQQIQRIVKNNLSEQTDVIIQEQKIFCHFCPAKIEMISKESFYKFPDGKIVFFCNNQEKDSWLKQYKLNS